MASVTPRDAHLRGVVQRVWYYADAEAPAVRERRLPTGAVQLLINLAGERTSAWRPGGRTRQTLGRAVVQGPFTTGLDLDVSEQRELIGVVLAPGAARQLLGAPMEAFADQLVSLDDVLGPSATHALEDQVLGKAGAVEQQLEAVVRWLRQQVRPDPSPLARAALAAIDEGQSRIDVLADQLGVGERRLRRLFLREVGHAPKRVARVRRLQRALPLLQSALPLVDVACAAGFVDQAHLGHELQALGGLSPRAYRRARPAMANHVRLGRVGVSEIDKTNAAGA